MRPQTRNDSPDRWEIDKNNADKETDDGDRFDFIFVVVVVVVVIWQAL